MAQTQASARKTYVVDTNVLLLNPKILSEFRNAEVVLPHVVLSELDKVKGSRGDSELRYRGREVSRLLFELSEKGDLTKGVPLNNNSRLRVANFEPSADLPSALRNKTADDLIVALALDLSAKNNSPVVLMTNDLNMLIKAQSLGIAVERSQTDEKGALWARISRRWPTQIFPVLVVVLLIGLLLSMVTLVNWVTNPQPSVNGTTSGPAASDADLIRRYQAQLTGKPTDFKLLVALGDIYQRRHEWSQAAVYYSRAVLLNSRDLNVRTNLAIAYFNTGRQQLAIQVLDQIVNEDWSYAPAHYNMGAMYYTLALASREAKRDADAEEFLRRAELQLNVYLKLDPNGSSAESAKGQLRDIKRQLGSTSTPGSS